MIVTSVIALHLMNKGGEPITLAVNGSRENSSFISSLLRDRPPHPAPGILYVAGIPRYDVDVQVHNRLAGGGADVDADVVAVGMELFVEEGFCLPDEGEEGDVLRVGRVEEGGDVPDPRGGVRGAIPEKRVY